MLRPSIEVNYGQKLDKLKMAPWLVSGWLTCTRIGNVMWEKSNKLSQHKKTEPVSFYLLMVTATFNFNPIIPRVNWMILTFIWVVKQELMSPKLCLDIFSEPHCWWSQTRCLLSTGLRIWLRNRNLETLPTHWSWHTHTQSSESGETQQRRLETVTPGPGMERQRCGCWWRVCSARWHTWAGGDSFQGYLYKGIECKS